MAFITCYTIKGTQNILGVDIPYFIIGDPAYPLQSWLMKGFSGILLPDEENFNKHLNAARVVVEIAFGRLKSRWRILSKKMDIHYKFAPKVAAACCILHNVLEDNKEQVRFETNEGTRFLQNHDMPPLQQMRFYTATETHGNLYRNTLCQYLNQL